MAESDIAVRVVADDETVRVDPVTGTVEEDQPDGSVVVRLDDHRPGKGKDDDEKWFRNLVDDIEPGELGKIADELVQGIRADDASRQEWLENSARGFDVLGIKIAEPKGDSEDEGTVSSVTNPLLLEACLKGWANAEAELLPASGPAKVEIDTDANLEKDELAEKLEQGLNYFFTKTATEYYPDTSHMLLWGTYFKGSGFKKVYRCPMRRRPTSESVDGKDLIMSDTTKDFYSCGRITHEIAMRPSMFKRMVLIGAYKSVLGDQQPNSTPNRVDEKIAGIQGTAAVPSRPEDKPYTIWESQCELDLDEFIPDGSDFKGKNIPLPYVVAIDKDTQEILAVRRDWDDDDDMCHRLRMYVKYPYIPGPGAYGTGLLNILGNASAAMTGAWRLALDAGMYANFPGGLISKATSRQETNNFRPNPGEFVPVETGGQPVRDAVMELPYHDVTPGLMQLIDKITEQCRALGQGAEIPAGEGLQNIPVGTMLAQIEQATKVMSASHKGLHKAQSEEIQLILELFRRNPEDFWRDNKEDKKYWNEELLLKALEEKTITPVSDPNVPSHIHRLAKVLALIQLKGIFPQLRDDRILRRALAVLHEDYDDLVDPNFQPQAAQDPKMAAAIITGQAKMADVQVKAQKLGVDEKDIQLRTAAKAAEMASEERQHELDVKKEEIIHGADQQKLEASEHRDAVLAESKLELERSQHAHEVEHDQKEHALKVQQAGVASMQGDRQHGLAMAEHALEKEQAAHEAALNVHTALNPPKPAAAKPKPKK